MTKNEKLREAALALVASAGPIPDPNRTTVGGEEYRRLVDALNRRNDDEVSLRERRVNELAAMIMKLHEMWAEDRRGEVED